MFSNNDSLSLGELLAMAKKDQAQPAEISATWYYFGRNRSLKRLKVATFIYLQVAAAHCPNERTLDPAVCSQTDPTMLQPAALWPSPRNVLWQRLTIFSSEYYQILIVTHLPTPEGWKAKLA